MSIEDAPRCTATAKSTGERCSQPAIAGGTVCRKHGGSSPQVKAKAAVRAEVLSWGLGDATDDPGEVLLRLVTQSRQRVEMYAAEMQRKAGEAGADLEAILVGTGYTEGGATYEYIRGLAQLEAQERDRLANFTAKAIAAGLAERQVRVAEKAGQMLAFVLGALLDDSQLGLTAEQRKLVPDVIERASIEAQRR